MDGINGARRHCLFCFAGDDLHFGQAHCWAVHPFDLLIIMLLSEAVSNSMSGVDESLLGGLILAATLIAWNFTIGLVTSRSHNVADLVDGTAELIGRMG